MAYIVFALGAVMSLIGVYAVITGYPIIQVERGWATVISGSVMFTGGLVTIGLGLILQTLLRIQSVLQTEGRLGTPERAHAHVIEPSMAAIPQDVDPMPPRTFETIPTEQESVPQGFVEPLVATHAETEIPGEKTDRIDAEDERHPQDPHNVPFAQDTSEAQDETRHETPHESIDDGVPMQASHDPIAETHDERAYEPVDLDHYELQSPSTPDHDLVSSEPVTAHEPALESNQDDWLDRALTSLDEELGPIRRQNGGATGYGRPEATAPDHDERLGDEVATEQMALPKATYLEPRQSEPAELAAWAPPIANEPAVIGRYESDGTIYVMFADGSIEAQSEAGVYRFQSMAELKAFIEG